jgi:glutamine synthetase
MAKTSSDVLTIIKDSGVKFVDIRFVDVLGMWHHFSLPAHRVDESLFTDGFPFDGSSVRGFQTIDESDMLLVPDASSAFLDPFAEVPTLILIADVEDPITRSVYPRDPRSLAKRAEEFLKSEGIADVAYFGPEAEFYVFNSIRYGQSANEGFYHIDSNEAAWNSGRVEEGGNLGYKMRTKEGYFPTPPADTLQDLRSEMVTNLLEAGIEVDAHHHEVGNAGQCEIGIKFDSLVNMADKLLMHKYIVKNTAAVNGYTATFMPKPIFQDNGSGMHTSVSFWKDGKNLFFDPEGYGKLSQTAIYYIGGILKHAPALLAFGASSTNSYRRLVPGYEAPINLVYSARNRSAAIRIPVVGSEKSKRVEFRAPDPTANPYLLFAAMVLAGIDGIKNKIEPPAPVDKDIYELSAHERMGIAQTPGSLNEVLNALEQDHEFLLQGDVFSLGLIETYISLKRLREVEGVALRPHPYEFFLYYDC